MHARMHDETGMEGWVITYHTVVKVLLRGTHPDRHTEPLQDLAASLSQDMQTDDLLVFARADDLVSCGLLLIGVHHSEVHSLEFGLVDSDLVAVLLAGLGLR